MDEAEKKRILDSIKKNAEKGNFDLDPYIKRSGFPIKDVQSAANLQEAAMGSSALEQFKGRIPNRGENMQNFMEQFRDQFVPKSKAPISIDSKIPDMGEFDPKTGLIKIKPHASLDDLAGSLIHEPLHEVDLANKDYGDLYKQKSGPSFNKVIAKINPELVDQFGNITNIKKAKELIKSIDINDLKELLLEGHHGLKRGATIAQANLPRILKGLPALGIAGVALSGDPAVAAEELVGQAAGLAAPIAAKIGAGSIAGPVGLAALAAQQVLGPKESGNIEEERMMLAEDKARKSYNKSPAKMARLRKLMGR